MRASSKTLAARPEDDGGPADAPPAGTDAADDIDLLAESIDTVRQRLQAWVAAADTPSPDDVAYVSRFLVASVRGGNTELAYLAVRSLQRYRRGQTAAAKQAAAPLTDLSVCGGPPQDCPGVVLRTCMEGRRPAVCERPAGRGRSAARKAAAT